MTNYLATVHILVAATDCGEAADIISGVLTENGIYEPGSGIIDWSYCYARGRYQHAVKVDIPDDYDRVIFPLHTLARGRRS